MAGMLLNSFTQSQVLQASMRSFGNSSAENTATVENITLVVTAGFEFGQQNTTAQVSNIDFSVAQ